MSAAPQRVQFKVLQLSDHRRASRLHLVLDARDQVPTDLVITAWRRRPETALGVATHHEAFDARFFVSGDRTHVLSVLDAETRGELMRLDRGRRRLSVEKGRVTHEAAEAEIRSIGLDAMRAHLASLAARLAPAQRPAARLIENLVAEDEPYVRHRVLQHLRDLGELTAEARARVDASPVVRILFGLSLGDAGDELVASGVQDARGDERELPLAVEHLLSHDHPELEALCRALIPRASPENRRALQRAISDPLDRRGGLEILGQSPDSGALQLAENLLHPTSGAKVGHDERAPKEPK